MNALATRKAIQELLNAGADGIFGAKTQAAYDLLSGFQDGSAWPPVPKGDGELHRVKASTFADKEDVAAFRHCKAQGGSDQGCFKVGDNGIGFTGLDCSREDIAYVALPPEYWKPRFGSAAAAAGKGVNVTLKGKTVLCFLGDTMPHLANITNGCGIDLAPGAQKEFGIGPGTYEGVTWQWE